MAEKNDSNHENSITRDALWNVINRFDLFMGATNAKAALTIAFNTFVVSGIALKWKEILPSSKAHPYLAIIGGIFLAAAVAASILSLIFTFISVNPFQQSHEISDDYHSDIFFKHIAAHKAEGDYFDKVKEMSSDILAKDLAFQIHILSKGVSRKFEFLKYATQTIICAQLPSIFLVVVIKLIAFIADSG